MDGNTGEDGGLDLHTRKKSMRSITGDGMAYSVMTGLGDAYLPASLVLLGASDFWIGMLAALPQLFGGIAQAFSLAAMRIVKDRKLLVMAGSFVQALCWLPVIALLLWPGEMSVPLIIFFFSLGAGASLLINPVWSSWVADIVPENERAGFFANRNRLMQVMLFAVTFGGGMLVRQLQMNYAAAVAFGMMFCVAFFARLASVFFHSRTANVPYEIKLMNEIKMKHLFLLPAYKNELWFLAFVALMNFAVQFSSPFFTPYMLNTLKMDMGMFGILTAISIITKIICSHYWGAAIDRFSNRTVLIATAFMAPIVPLLWLFSGDVWMLALFQVFSGFIWAGYDLAVFNSALSLVGRELRPSFISKYNAFGCIANAAGALAGGVFLSMYPDMGMLGFSGILLVFLLSGLMRMVVAIAFAPKLATSREIANTTADRAMVFKLVAVYPTQGAVAQVANGWDFTRKIVGRSTESSGNMLHEGLAATLELAKEGARRLMSKISRKGRL
ncbi:MAG: MFS transporter [Candidatus Micrarchaeia archaeon]